MKIEDSIVGFLKARGSATAAEIGGALKANGLLADAGPDVEGAVNVFLFNLRGMGMVTARNDREGVRWFPRLWA